MTPSALPKALLLIVAFLPHRVSSQTRPADSPWESADPSADEHGDLIADTDVVTGALVAELDRSMKNIVLGDLPRPYFIQYAAEDRVTCTLRASYGGITRFEEDRVRFGTSRVRVGSFTLDNTNVGAGVGGRALFPLDDDLTALRHAVWSMTDSDYKQALEILTRKQAYLRQKFIEDRPDDFSPAEPSRDREPLPTLAFDRAAWRRNVADLSGRFQRLPEIQEAEVSFLAGTSTQWLVNSEGTRLRRGDTGVLIEVRAETQADDGMKLTDRRSYLGLQVADLPPLEKMQSDVDEMGRQLLALRAAPILEHYSGPVLFEPQAAGVVFEAMLAEGLCARPLPLGETGSGDRSLEKKIGLRILPKSFLVYDDPTEEYLDGKVLAGAYTYDDEGVKASRVTLVENGILTTLLAGRAPTKKIKHSTGHGRAAGFSAPSAAIGCLYISSSDGLSADELKSELIQAAKDEGLEFGLRVESLSPDNEDAPGDIPNPIYLYKVYVADGREELVRGMEFLPVEVKSLKRIIAAGRDRKVHNTISGVSTSLIAPAVLFEELELNKIEQEFDKPPILPSPLTRGRPVTD
jgi:hypothetical protein